jgi:hypothetical protein
VSLATRVLMNINEVGPPLNYLCKFESNGMFSSVAMAIFVFDPLPLTNVCRTLTPIYLVPAKTYPVKTKSEF